MVHAMIRLNSFLSRHVSFKVIFLNEQSDDKKMICCFSPQVLENTLQRMELDILYFFSIKDSSKVFYSYLKT